MGKQDEVPGGLRESHAKAEDPEHMRKSGWLRSVAAWEREITKDKNTKDEKYSIVIPLLGDTGRGKTHAVCAATTWATTGYRKRAVVSYDPGNYIQEKAKRWYNDEHFGSTPAKEFHPIQFTFKRLSLSQAINRTIKITMYDIFGGNYSKAVQLPNNEVRYEPTPDFKDYMRLANGFMLFLDIFEAAKEQKLNLNETNFRESGRVALAKECQKFDNAIPALGGETALKTMPVAVIFPKTDLFRNIALKTLEQMLETIPQTQGRLPRHKLFRLSSNDIKSAIRGAQPSTMPASFDEIFRYFATELCL